MSKIVRFLFLTAMVILTIAFLPRKDKVTIYLIGDSTVADYTLYEEDYMTTRYPVTGWGQVFQSFLSPDSLKLLHGLVNADSALVDNRARGGRSTRTFFQEGRWRSVYEALQKNDLVLMQFGHNDGAENKPERYTDIEAYKEFLRLYVSQTLQKGAIPIILTPVTRNYPWKDGVLSNVHGEYPEAARQVAEEFGIACIDLTKRSTEAFTRKGRDYVSEKYFMNLEPGVYEAYPDGQDDNTHFQPEGARAVAQLVFDGLKELARDH